MSRLTARLLQCLFVVLLLAALCGVSSGNDDSAAEKTQHAQLEEEVQQAVELR